MHLGSYDNSPSRKLFWLFTILMIAGALLVISLVTTRATIVIHPKIEKKESVVNLTIDTRALKPDIASAVLPGRIVENEGEITSQITGISTEKRNDFAEGTVKIKNVWSRDFSFQKGTQLIQGESPQATAGQVRKVFILDTAVTVPAGGEVTAALTATRKGPGGNIPPGKFYFLRMSQANRQRFWAQNDQPFSGGEIDVKVVAEEDINRARQSAAENLGKQEIQKMSAQVSEGARLSPALTQVEILESRTNAKPKEERESLEMFVRGKVSSIAFNEKDLRETAVAKFEQQVGSDQEVSAVDENEIRYELSDLSGADGKAEVKVIIPAVLSPKLPSKIFDKKSIAGYNEAALRERFSRFPEIESIDVKFFPFWTKSVPSFEGQVGFDIEND